MCVALWELSVGMQPLSTAPHAFLSWLEVGSVCARLRRDGRVGGRQRGRSGNIPSSRGVGGGFLRGPEKPKGKTEEGGWRFDVDTKWSVFSHSDCRTRRDLHKFQVD